jgi:hypothetical protein
MYYVVTTNSTCFALLPLSQHVCFVTTNSTCKWYRSNTCWDSGNKVIHVELVVTKQTCWDSGNKATHGELVVTT